MLASEERPAEAVDDADHWIQRIDEPPLWRNYLAQKTHWRDVQAKLDNKRNDEAKVPVPHHQRSGPKSGCERGSQCQEDERRKEQNASWRYETVPEEQD